MERRRDTITNADRPITKPRFPLSQDFGRGLNDARLSIEEVALKDQRAHFYRKGVTEFGKPVYDFVITAENEGGESH
jgi:hypothetical protein